MSAKFNFPGLQPVVRIIDEVGEVVSLSDTDTDTSRFLRAKSSSNGRQILELSEAGNFIHIREIELISEQPSELWPDVKARFFFDRDTNTWRTCFFVLPSVKVNLHNQRRWRRDLDASGPNIETGIGKVEGRRAIDKQTWIVTSRKKS